MVKLSVWVLNDSKRKDVQTPDDSHEILAQWNVTQLVVKRLWKMNKYEQTELGVMKYEIT